ncbi:UNVERIFIED_CONTAM: hypothetical protein Sradi_4114100 [Sesamum radiatum]|uniref:Uncharacterized protein n=1 Tax=Sesamum radiatum TaxID=300843 RepID=A0AAW2P1D2_SESRA
MQHYEGWSTLDDEDTADTNVASVTPTNGMHILKNKQEALPPPPAVPPKLWLNIFGPIELDTSIVDMKPFTKAKSYVGDVKLYLNPMGCKKPCIQSF